MNSARPPWEEIYLAMAFVMSRRSHDDETRHGCIIADREHRVLGAGFNGFPRGLRDAELPARRPEKYAWMVHSERNAVSNCTLRPDGATAYVTGEPCNDCLMHLWQNGVRRVVYARRHGSYLIDGAARRVRETFLEMSGMAFESYEPQPEWLAMTKTGG
jgi:dCMP deaminase